MTVSCDFLCIGGGLGGLAGAVCAADAGLDVIVLEKTALLGGVASYSAGHVWVPGNHLRSTPGDVDDAIRYMAHLCGDLAAEEEVRADIVAAGPEVFRYLSDEVGIPFTVIDGYPDFLHPDAPGSAADGRMLEVALPGASLGELRPALRPGPHFPSGLTRVELMRHGGALGSEEVAALRRDRERADYLTLGEGLAGGFVRAALTEGRAKVMVEARVHRLTMDGGRVTGAEVTVAGDRTEIRARRGVLIATGGYGAAPYAARFETLPEIVEAGPPVTTGDHLDLTDPTPAALVRAGRPFTVLGFHIPGRMHPGTEVPLFHQAFTSFGFPHSIIVNRAGERFGDESLHGQPPGVTDVDPLTARYPNYPCYLIADDRFRRRYPFGPLEAGEDWPEVWPHADDPGSLAEELGVDPARFAKTIDRFNAGVAGGVDPQFGRGRLPHVQKAYGDPTYSNPNLGALTEPPFWGVRLTLLGVGIYSIGLHVDAAGRALDRAGRPVPGLYATGNSAAYAEQPAYVGGYANMRNIVLAARAADDAAAVR